MCNFNIQHFLSKCRSPLKNKAKTQAWDRWIRFHCSKNVRILSIGKAENIGKMIGDQYANYGILYIVVQRALSLATPTVLEKMLSNIKPKLEELKNSHFGKKIYLKLLKNYPVLID